MADELFMKRALELAKLGMADARPNPMVGCVIVHAGKIIGESFHEKFGEPHAEVNAINDVEQQELLCESTAYVTLEPCSHFGKTPPCSDLLIEKQLKRVVVCNVDPNPMVSGRGIRRMQEAGIEVEVGLLEDEGNKLNKRFFTFHTKQRPYIMLKWAQTADGFVARENFDSKWISNQYSRQLVHKWRSEESAIMVGTNTAKYDNPSLTVRDRVGKNPTRIVVDRNLTLDQSMNLFDGSVETLVFTQNVAEPKANVEFVTLDQLSPKAILEELHKRKLLSVLIEGGAALLNSFIEENLWDEARVFTATQKFEKGISAPKLDGKPTSEEDIKGDKLTTYFNS
ncbi:MAG: bifunctional diaminohydroxyphosphoribosylaminopyrimidine deaminase/5-amino-6-(5-phosphoribosylamino)uracil reductase RibD [Cyclobacteriaceae bacterium]